MCFNILIHQNFNDNVFVSRRKSSVGRLEDALEAEHDEYIELRSKNEEVEKQVHTLYLNTV